MCSSLTGRLGFFHMGLQGERSASITAASPGVLPSCVSKVTDTAFHALNAQSKMNWEDRSRPALVASNRLLALDQNKSQARHISVKVGLPGATQKR